LGVAKGFGLGSGGKSGCCPRGEGAVGVGDGRRERGSGQDVTVSVSGCSKKVVPDGEYERSSETRPARWRRALFAVGL
jgi:hypothetical protein